MKMRIGNGIHAVVMASALVLIAVSSKMAYSLSDLNTVLIMGVAAAVLDLVMMFVLKKSGALRDLLMLATTALATLCLCRVVTGRADLMGYVWFSDLEKGNPTAVTGLYLAVGSMACFLVSVFMNVVAGFRKDK